MGSPRQPKKKYSRPFKHWSKERLDYEAPLIKEFGLKNKKELWKVSSLLSKFAFQAKRLISLRGVQAEIEKRQMIGKLNSLGVISREASLDEVLGLTLKDFLARRLQTIVFKRNLARSVRQSRQFIVHRQIRIGDKVITSPSFLVPATIEGKVAFAETSALANPEHPERAVKAAVKEVPDAKE